MDTKASYYKSLLKDIWIASRPLSLTLALYSTTLGIVVAYRSAKLFTENMQLDIWKILLVTLAGLFVQTGTNFINDYFECEYKYRRQNDRKYSFLGKKRTRFDILIFLLGMGSFGATCVIGIFLIYLTTPKLLWVGLIGVIGGYSYTGEPIVYKRHGLGAILSFVLMGPLMVYGSYLVFAEQFSWAPIIIGLPLSLMIPMLMFSNELRDFERDKSLGIRTLTVRIGNKAGKLIFLTLLLLSFSLSALFIILGMLPTSAVLVFATIPLAIKSYNTVAVAKKEGVPITNRLHLTFGLITIITLLFK
ncbi:MAG: UbiA prenyltransferase [Clostridia bacterium]|jgi:1,4-dihydroxy-2-naphthoate octaprenyltransferase|nr:UbiA prenyltransferase [Clostridia bacterium]